MIAVLRTEVVNRITRVINDKNTEGHVIYKFYGTPARTGQAVPPAAKYIFPSAFCRTNPLPGSNREQFADRPKPASPDCPCPLQARALRLNQAVSASDQMQKGRHLQQLFCVRPRPGSAVRWSRSDSRRP